MRPLLALAVFIAACAHGPRPEGGSAHASASEPASIASPRAPIVVPGRSATELLELAGDASFLSDRGLSASVIDEDAMESWFVRPPARVYLYTERAIEDVSADGDAFAPGTCRPAGRDRTGTLNEIALVIAERGRYRTLLVLGQASARIEDRARAGGEWETEGARALPVETIAWDAQGVRYAEGAERYERACVPVLRRAACTSDGAEGGEGYCVDRELVIRPWRAAMVPHVGPVFPGYADAVPLVPEGACEATCEPSDCDRAFATSRLPREPLYDESAAELAVFREREACQAFARERSVDDRASEAAW